MVTIFGIKFAPLFIPLERRLQTIAVIYYMNEFVPLYTLSLIYLLFTRFYLIPILCALWCIYDRNSCRRGGRRSRWYRNAMIWHLVRDYFPISLVKTVDLDADKNYIFGVHPHGILCFGSFFNFATDVTGFNQHFPGLTSHLLVHEHLFKIPIHREVAILLGCFSVAKESIRYLLTERNVGNVAVIVVGGADEALNAVPNKIILTLNKRKGFVKMALETGAYLVPVLSFGENDIYFQAERDENSLVRRLQRKLKSWIGISQPLFYGRGIFQYSFGLLPFRKPIITVVGQPLPVTKTDAPTNEEIDTLHEQYVNSLRMLFDEYKEKLGFHNLVLLIK